MSGPMLMTPIGKIFCPLTQKWWRIFKTSDKKLCTFDDDGAPSDSLAEFIGREVYLDSPLGYHKVTVDWIMF